MGKLKVYYGWARIGNVRKKRALSVMFENEMLGAWAVFLDSLVTVIVYAFAILNAYHLA